MVYMELCEHENSTMAPELQIFTTPSPVHIKQQAHLYPTSNQQTSNKSGSKKHTAASNALHELQNKLDFWLSEHEVQS